MRKSTTPMKLSARILLSCLGCMLVALLIQLTLFNASSSRIIAAQVAIVNDNTLRNLSDDVYQRFKDVENGLISIYDHKDFIRALSSEGINTLREDYASLAYSMAFDAFDPSINLCALYIYTPSHEMICSYRHAQTPIYTYPADIYDGTMPDSSIGVKEIIASQPDVLTVTSYYNDKRDMRLVRCVLRILGSGRNQVGYMVCDVDPKGFRQILSKYRYSDEQALWLQPTNLPALLGELPATPQSQEAFEEVASALTRGERAQVAGYELYFTKLRKYDVTIYSLVSKQALNANQSALWNSTMLVFASLFVLFTVLFLFISRGLTKPLTQMVSTMNRIKMGETTVRLPDMKKDELGILGSEFNDMLDRIEGLIAREYQTTLQLNDAKYKALQMQVNPHFLYNTLDTMAAIAANNNCPLVSTLCRALSELFRYSLNMDEPLTTLSEELHHLKNYMFVMNVRMSDSLHLSLDLPSKLLSVRLPRLSLQPLVENAINHGLRNKRGDKNISISAKPDNEALLIVIEDNGVGMDKDLIESQLMFDANAAIEGGSSIGLKNINSRVKLLFGEEYGLSIASEPGKGCRVTLRIPREVADG